MVQIREIKAFQPVRGFHDIAPYMAKVNKSQQISKH